MHDFFKLDKTREPIIGYATLDVDFANKIWDIWHVEAEESIPAGTMVAIDPATGKVVGVVEGIEEEKDLSFEF